MRRTSIVAFAVITAACSSHPEEGTVVELGGGVTGIPGGSTGVSAWRAVPVSGGTLLVARDGVTAVAADPDRDRVFLVDLEAQSVREVVLELGDEPGRSVEDDARRVHVALRSGGAVASIDLATGAIVERRWACPAPRGIAFDGALQALHVACDTGELVTIPVTGDTVRRRIELGRDLRDVVVDGDRLLVTRFRSAELLVLDSSGATTSIRRPGGGFELFFDGIPRSPAVAWRTVQVPDTGSVLMLHQQASAVQVSVNPGGYGSGRGCRGGGIVLGAVTPMDPDDDPSQVPAPVRLPMIAGPSDVAVSRDGQQVAFVSTGDAWRMLQAQGPVPTTGRSPGDTFFDPRPVAVVSMSEVTDQLSVDHPCAVPPAAPGVTGEPIAVAFTGSGQVVVQSRQPAQLQILPGAWESGLGVAATTIVLSTDDRSDTGLALFHANSHAGLACASCHPEGRDDGRTWDLVGLGARRTQSLGGGLLQTAPFHWDGDMEDVSELVHEVFSRMDAPQPNRQQVQHFAAWLDTVPAAAAPVRDLARVERGRAVFEGVAGCAGCHTGPMLTNNQTHYVGTGGRFQVPTLRGIGGRAPFIHNGCAPTLMDRFTDTVCGGGDEHGNTSVLDETQLSDLVGYLEML